MIELLEYIRNWLCAFLCDDYCYWKYIDHLNNMYKIGYKDGKEGEEPMVPLP